MSDPRDELDWVLSHRVTCTIGELGPQERSNLDAARARVADLRRREWNSYAHMCQNDHVRIGHSDSDYEPEELSCPVCRERNRREALEERITALEGGLRDIIDAGCTPNAIYAIGENPWDAAKRLLGGQG